jgi:hypothetical protein
VVQPQQQAHQEAATQQQQQQQAGRSDDTTLSSHHEDTEAAVPPEPQASGVAAGDSATTHPHSSSGSMQSPNAALDTAADAAASTSPTAQQADAAASTAADTSSSSAPEQQQQQEEEQPTIQWYSFYQTIDEQPVPVQLPPPGCTNEPPAQPQILNKARYKSPAFLQHFPAPPKGAPYNFLSFLGPVEWQGGKYQVSPAALDDFLLPYFNTAFYSKRRLHIAQSYQGQPYK